MNTWHRRVFLAQALAGSAALVATRAGAQGAADKLIDEADPQAMALGYKADTNKVDAKAYAKHAANQTCSNCQLYAGKASDAAASCAVFPGKNVAAQGWGSAWVKRA